MWLYAKFCGLSLVGVGVYFLGVFVSISIQRTLSHADHRNYGDMLFGNYDHYSYVGLYGGVVSMVLASLYYGGLVIWLSVWVFDRAVARLRTVSE